MIVFCRKIHHLLELDFELNVDFKIGCVKTGYILVFEEFEPSSGTTTKPKQTKRNFWQPTLSSSQKTDEVPPLPVGGNLAESASEFFNCWHARLEARSTSKDFQKKVCYN